MAEVVVELMQTVTDDSGNAYGVLACGDPTPDGTWHGWLEFVSAQDGSRLRSPRETTQPNRADTVYWATGLTPTYLEGAFARATSAAVAHPSRSRPERGADPASGRPRVEGAPSSARTQAIVPRTEAVLDPFSVYAKGETLLRQQLRAMASWHLVNIAVAYGLTDRTEAELNTLDRSELVSLIVTAVVAAADPARRRP